MGLTAPAPNNGVALITLRLIMRPYPSLPKRWTLAALKNHKYYIIMLKIKLGTNTIPPLEILKLVKVTRLTTVWTTKLLFTPWYKRSPKLIFSIVLSILMLHPTSQASPILQPWTKLSALPIQQELMAPQILQQLNPQLILQKLRLNLQFNLRKTKRRKTRRSHLLLTNVKNVLQLQSYLSQEERLKHSWMLTIISLWANLIRKEIMQSSR